MRSEDKRGHSSNLISREGRGGPLCFGEKEALAMQAKNRRLSDDMTPGQFEEANLKRISTSSNGLKEPRRVRY
jgi:hypothetical protein